MPRYFNWSVQAKRPRGGWNIYVNNEYKFIKKNGMCISHSLVYRRGNGQSLAWRYVLTGSLGEEVQVLKRYHGLLESNFRTYEQSTPLNRFRGNTTRITTTSKTRRINVPFLQKIDKTITESFKGNGYPLTGSLFSRQ